MRERERERERERQRDRGTERQRERERERERERDRETEGQRDRERERDVAMCMYVNLCEMASIVFNYHQCCPSALSLPGQRVKEQLQKARISVTINMCTLISKSVSVVYMRLSGCTYPEVRSGSSFQSRLVFVISLSEQLLLHTPSWLSIEGKHVQNIIMLQRYNNIPGPLYHFLFVFICTVHLIKTIVGQLYAHV